MTMRDPNAIEPSDKVIERKNALRVARLGNP